VVDSDIVIDHGRVNSSYLIDNCDILVYE